MKISIFVFCNAPLIYESGERNSCYFFPGFIIVIGNDCMTKAKKRKKEEFNDLLIPIILVLCVMPFIIRLVEYSCGYSIYPWYSENDIIMDIYCYFRCYFFEIVAIFSLAIVCFRWGLYKENRKNIKMFIPLAVYGGMAVVSTFTTVNPQASLSGNFYQFQGIIVILGYIIMCFYAYQIMEREQDFKIIFYGILIVFLVMCVVGIFQIARMDLLNFEFFQRLIMSKEQFELYGGEMDTVFTGSNVFLTLYNPNYAGVYLTMMASVFGVMFYSEEERKRKLFYGVLLLASLLLIWFTYSRATLIAIGVAMICFLCLIREKTGKVLKYLVPGILILIVFFLAIDGIQGFKYISRFVDEKKEVLLEEIYTRENGVELIYDGQQMLITIEDKSPVVYDKTGAKVEVIQKENNEIVIPVEKEICVFTENRGYEEDIVYDEMEKSDGDGVEEKVEYLHLLIEDYTYSFIYDGENYFYINEVGKEDTMTTIEKVDFGGYEYLGSGRVYIWSRTLPLLKDYLIVGSGPDTFPEVFPQKDYVGKAIYADTSARIMEKPHNDYLMQWVQNGFIGFLGMICFYILLLKKGWTSFRRQPLDNMKARMGMGCFLACICYMVSSMFNDSTLFTTPVFWVFAGIALAAGYQEKKENERK